mgnify:CR=1 FL=1
MNNVKLIDSEELLRRYPALRSRKGQKRTYRLEWLVRSRRIPIVRIGRRNYFDPCDIEAWIERQKIPAGGE